MKSFKAIFFYFPLTILLMTVLPASIGAQGWEELSGPPFNKHHNNGFGINGKAYVLEGVISAEEDINFGSNEVWEYDPQSDNWQQLNNFPGPARGFAIGDEWDGKYYYGFGGSLSGVYNDLWVFDPSDQTFTELPSCPCVGRNHPAFIAHNDKIYMGSGSGPNSDLDDWWEYDILTMEWTEKPSIPGGQRHHPFQFTIEDKIYVGGGHVFNWLEYDPATEQWTEISNIPGGRVAGSQFEYNGMGYLLGGDDASHYHVPSNETFIRYNALADVWESLPPLPNGSKWAPASFIIEDELYFFGGINFDQFGDLGMWKFDLRTLDMPVATEDLNSINQSEIYLYPNPVEDKLNFGTHSVVDPIFNLNLVTLQGKTILTKPNFSIDQPLELFNLPSGAYLLELSNGKELFSYKLIKTVK